jgi:pimeloyl-ACP methyl ester carboxylesterase
MRPPFLSLAPAALLFSLHLSAPLAAGAAPPPKVDLKPCQVPGLAQEARCGTLEVYENRVAQSGRKIGISFVVVPATGTTHATEAIFNFAGGPGGAAIQEIGGLIQAFATLRETRDLVAVDVRGTGRSAPLDCKQLYGKDVVQSFLDEFMPARGTAACRKELERDHDLRFYTTPLAIDDVDDVRAALGYEKIDLVGGSYGTRAGLVYLQRHAPHVRAAVLEGLVPTRDRSPLTFARDAQASLDKVFAACAAEPQCHAAFPDPAADLAQAFQRVEKAPVEVQLKDSETGNPVTLRFGRAGLAQTVRYMLYSPTTHLLLPLYLHEAARGSFQPLGRMAQTWGGLATSLSDGFFLSVTCAEDVPFYTPEEAEAAARGTFLGDFRARAQKAACAEWPRGALPPGYGEPVRSNVPVLLFSGERDPVTPAVFGAEVARALPNSLHLVVPAGAHGSDGLEGGGDCLERLALEVIRNARVKGLDTSCVAKLHAPPFQTELANETEVEVPEAELAKLTGSYAATGGQLQLNVRLADGRLKLELPGRPPFVLTAVGPLRFKIEGAPPGFFMTFAPKGSGGMAAALEEGSSTTSEQLERKPQ